MLYQATHTTRYLYEAPVSHCQSEVRLTPRSLPWQTVFESTIRTTPAPVSFDERRDYFGNAVSAFAIVEANDRFEPVATSLVRVEANPVAPNRAATWEDARARLADHHQAADLEAVEFVFDSPFVAAGAELADYAHPSFTHGRPLVEAVRDLSHRIHR